jgi:hypothetical protein
MTRLGTVLIAFGRRWRRGRIFLPTMSSRNTALKYLTATKIGKKGQLTVVKEFRKDLGLETGAPIAVLRLGMG